MTSTHARYLEDREPDIWACSNDPFRSELALIKSQPLSQRRAYKWFAGGASGWQLDHPSELSKAHAHHIQPHAAPLIHGSWDNAWRDELVRSLVSTGDLTQQLEAIISNRLAVSAVCEDARDLLSLEEDWDGFGSPVFEEETIERAISLVQRLADSAEKLFRLLPTPDINPADEGGIDIAWDLAHGMLLINVPSRQEEDATFFGESDSHGTVAGEIKAGCERSDLVAWLIQLG